MIEMYDLAPPVRHTDRWDIVHWPSLEVVVSGLPLEQRTCVLEELAKYHQPGFCYLGVRPERIVDNADATMESTCG